MSIEEFIAFFKEHPELVPRALELLRENEKNPTFLDSVGCTRKPSTPGQKKNNGFARWPYSWCPLTIPPASCACARA